jgi:hypothetical protein
MRALPTVILAVVAACNGPLDRKRLHGAIEDLSSTAAETRTLAAQEGAGGLAEAYADGQRDALADRVRDALSQLGRGVEDPALDPDRRTAAAAGRRLLAAVQTAADLRELSELARRLGALAAEVRP